MTAKASPYIGRFAPSPSGPLHLGSLFAALASYLDARAHNGKWLLRIEDVDTHRSVAGSADSIRRCLEKHGLEWDAQVPAQSERTERYQQALEQLSQLGATYHCDCTRKKIRQLGSVYPGTCRSRRQARYVPATRSSPASHAIRLNTSLVSDHVEFKDRILGAVNFDLTELGDFILRRRDSLYAYQLAVVVDDLDQNINAVVRGQDLLNSTPWQLLLYQLFNAQPPTFAHLPVLVSLRDHMKLSKQTGAAAVDEVSGSANIIHCLQLLGQETEQLNAAMSIQELLDIAISRWTIGQVPHSSLPV